MGLLGDITIIPGTGAIAGIDIWATYATKFHEHSKELGEILVPLVQAKTPVLSGSLQGDMTFENYEDPKVDDLVFVYAADEQQMDYWGRVYVQYQEGGLLGLPTYTNPPREMFELTAEGDGFDETVAWAEAAALEAQADILGGGGIPI